jgi:hypothetical protein
MRKVGNHYGKGKTMNEATQEPAATGGVTPQKDGTVIVVDPQGRKLKVKKLNALDRMRLYGIAGADNSGNDRFMGYAAIAASVTEIGGEPVMFPESLFQLEALVQRLDEDGIEASARGMQALAKQRDGRDVAAAARNL